MHKADQWEERNIAYENIVDAMEVPLVDAYYPILGCFFLDFSLLIC